MECLLCNFKCKLKTDYKRHILTQTHIFKEESVNYTQYFLLHQKKYNRLIIQFKIRAIYPRVLYELKEITKIIN